MNPSQDEFEQLRRVLVIKRYESPPPGYFNHFSDRVIARIESDALVIEHSWWQRLVLSFDAKPIVACAYSVGVGGLLFVGMSVVQVLEQEHAEAAPPNSAGEAWAALPLRPARAQMAGSQIPLAETSATASSINPVISAGAPSFLFAPPSANTAQPASFSFR